MLFAYMCIILNQIITSMQTGHPPISSFSFLLFFLKFTEFPLQLLLKTDRQNTLFCLCTDPHRNSIYMYVHRELPTAPWTVQGFFRSTPEANPCFWGHAADRYPHAWSGDVMATGNDRLTIAYEVFCGWKPQPNNPLIPKLEYLLYFSCAGYMLLFPAFRGFSTQILQG